MVAAPVELRRCCRGCVGATSANGGTDVAGMVAVSMDGMTMGPLMELRLRWRGCVGAATAATTREGAVRIE